MERPDGMEGEGEPCNCVSQGDYSMQSNQPRPRVCDCDDSEDGQFAGTPTNTVYDQMSNFPEVEDEQQWQSHVQRYQDQQNVVVADNNKTSYRCITVGIPNAIGRTL